MKMLSLIVSAAVIVAFCIAPCAAWLGLVSESPWWSRLTYLFIHGSWLHVAVNVYSLLVLAFMSNARPWQGMAAFVIALLLPDAVLSDTPVVGLSTFIYALTGIVVMNSRRWIALVSANALLLAAGSVFFDVFAVWPHIWCFSCGLAVGLVTSKRLRYD